MENLFILKSQQSEYLVSKGMVNSNDFIKNKLNSLGIGTSVVVVRDDNEIDKYLYAYEPKNAFIEAIYCRPVKLKELANKYPKIKFSVRCHSKAPFLATESSVAMEWLYQYTRLQDNVHISCNNKDFAQDLSDVFCTDKVDYLPNIYWPKNFQYSWYRDPLPETDEINIGCFGAIRSFKNNLQQAIASIKFADDMGKSLNFCINAGRVEGHGENPLKNLRSLFENHPKHILVECPWMSHDEFLKFLAVMDISLSVSLSESFNIVFANSIDRNVVSVPSVDIDWAPAIYRATPTDTQDIVARMHLAYKFPRINNILNTAALKIYNTKATRVWLNYLGK